MKRKSYLEGTQAEDSDLMTEKRLVVVFKPEGKAYEGQETRIALSASFRRFVR
jgi:hypothetical protein